MKRALLIVCALSVCAFIGRPDRQGYGAGVTGGSGQTVIEVTSTDQGTGTCPDPASCTFRTAVATGNRYVIFSVSGTITLTSPLTITVDNLTLDGSSAPNQGVAIAGRAVTLDGADNFHMRHMRFRLGGASNPAIAEDAFAIIQSDGCLIEYSSFSWGRDETLSFNGVSNPVRNCTVQYSIVSETMGAAGGQTNHQHGALILGDSSRITFYRNLFHGLRFRAPQLGGPTPVFSEFQVMENVLHGVRYAGPQYAPSGSVMVADWIENDSRESTDRIDDTSDVMIEVDTTLNLGTTTFYVDDNRSWHTDPATDANCGGSANNHGRIMEEDNSGECTAESHRSDTPQTFGVSTRPGVANVWPTIKDRVGAWLPCRDAIDARLVADVDAGDGAELLTGPESGGTDETDIGGYPDLSQPCT